MMVIILICSLATPPDQCDEMTAIAVIKPQATQGMTCHKADAPVYAGEPTYAVIRCGQ